MGDKFDDLPDVLKDIQSFLRIGRGQAYELVNSRRVKTGEHRALKQLINRITYIRNENDIDLYAARTASVFLSL